MSRLHSLCIKKLPEDITLTEEQSPKIIEATYETAREMLEHEDWNRIDVGLKSARQSYVDNPESVQSFNTSVSHGVGTEVRYALTRAKDGVSDQASHRIVSDWVPRESEITSLYCVLTRPRSFENRAWLQRTR